MALGEADTVYLGIGFAEGVAVTASAGSKVGMASVYETGSVPPMFAGAGNCSTGSLFCATRV